MFSVSPENAICRLKHYPDFVLIAFGFKVLYERYSCPRKTYACPFWLDSIDQNLAIVYVSQYSKLCSRFHTNIVCSLKWRWTLSSTSTWCSHPAVFVPPRHSTLLTNSYILHFCYTHAVTPLQRCGKRLYFYFIGTLCFWNASSRQVVLSI